MQLPASAVLVATLVIAAGAAAVTPVNAEPAMSDVAYMQAARCAGLAQGAKMDTTKIDALLRDQQLGRESVAVDRGGEMRDDARRQASHAGPIERQQLAAEMNGACRAYLGTTMASAGTNGHGE